MLISPALNELAQNADFFQREPVFRVLTFFLVDEIPAVKILIDDEGKKSSHDIGNNKTFGKINKLIVGSVSGNMFDDKEFTISFFKTKGLC